MPDLRSGLERYLTGGRAVPGDAQGQARAAGMSARELATRTGRSVRQAQRYLSGQARPRGDAADALTRAARQGVAGDRLGRMSRGVRVTGRQGPKVTGRRLKSGNWGTGGGQEHEYLRMRTTSVPMSDEQREAFEDAYLSGDMDRATDIIQEAANDYMQGGNTAAEWNFDDISGMEFI